MKTILRKRPLSNVPAVQDVEAYLQSKGWYKVHSENPNAHIFHGLKDVYGEPIAVVLPARDDVIDAKPRLNDVIRTLSVIAAKSPALVAREITTYGKHRGLRAETGQGTAQTNGSSSH